MSIASEKNLFHRLHVLVVDDNQFVRKLMRSMLRQLGVHEVMEATDGLDAIEVLSARDCDIILLDWRMPGFNGEEFLEMARRSNEPKMRAMPIVVVSAFTDYETVLRIAEAGADAVVTKPLSVSVLGQRVLKVLKDRHIPTRSAGENVSRGAVLARRNRAADPTSTATPRPAHPPAAKPAKAPAIDLSALEDEDDFYAI
ncbi:MAG: hypothetical protein C0606_17930 [Hyphomicrobiales bacterium]|nr:MAG: hypothetical protein C0606_17930 [Hyphomicrobiales bacterium]